MELVRLEKYRQGRTYDITFPTKRNVISMFCTVERLVRMGCVYTRKKWIKSQAEDMIPRTFPQN
jgi:hypothetical protein